MSQFLSLLATVNVGRESGIGYTRFSHYNPFIVMLSPVVMGVGRGYHWEDLVMDLNVDGLGVMVI